MTQIRAQQADITALLASCYHQSLQLAADHRLRSIAFPAISTGAYGYPLQAASEIALRTVKDFVFRPDGAG
jgi:O-acetyl-ADP-ribose deacetylase